MWRHPALELGSHMPSFTGFFTPLRLSEFQAALTRLRNSLDCLNCSPPAAPSLTTQPLILLPGQGHITCSSSSRRALNPRALTTNVVAELQVSHTCHKFRRRLKSVEIDTRSKFAPRATSPPNSSPDDSSPPRTSEPQPRSRAELTLAQVSPVFVRVCTTGRRPGSFKTCSSPRTTSHPHHSSPAAPASLFSSLTQDTNPILFQIQTTPTRTTPSPSPSPTPLCHTTCLSSSQSSPHLSFIQTQYHPRPVFIKAPVHLTHSQRHPTRHLFQTSRTPAPENRHQPCLCSSPGASLHLSKIQTRANPAPA